MKKGNLSLLSVFSLALLLVGAVAIGQEEGSSSIVIEGEKVNFDYSKNIISLSGNVKVDLKMVLISCRMLKLFLDNDKRVKRIVAEGSVTLNWNNITVNSEQLIFELDTLQVILPQKTRVLKKGGEIFAESGSINLKTHAFQLNKVRLTLQWGLP